jgi:N-acetylneuraminic acid mutarotase
MNLANIVLILLAFGPALAADKSPAPPHPKALKPMLKIDWKKGPSLPQGFQDSDGGIVDNTLITVCGFCGGGKSGVPGKETKYPRGFLTKTWGLDLSNPQRGWHTLPDFPGAARQELFAIVVDGALYCWGGFSYTAPSCYKDGYRLSNRGGAWVWEPLPALPFLLSSSGICALGSEIYVSGGADYDVSGDGAFFTATDRTGIIKRLGARLLVIDTKDLKAGWKELPPCPGTHRAVHAMAAVGGKLYVIGGAGWHSAKWAKEHPGPGGRAIIGGTVVDNWRFDPKTAKWDRLPDTPIATGNFPSGAIVFDNRWIVLIGGYQYEFVLNPDDTYRVPYGKVTKHYPEKDYASDMLVFDASTETFGKADPLPLNNNLPMAVLKGNQLHLIGGETAGCVLEGETFAHHPDLYLVGTIRTSE